MSLDSAFTKYRPIVQSYLSQFLREQAESFKNIPRWGEDVFKRLERFSCTGKTIRGCQVLFAANLGRARVSSQDALKAAAALELVHSSLLIHDDIIDRDLTRRGEKTIFAQYKEFAERENFEDAYHFGESVGLCVGDIGFFLAFKLLGTMGSESRIKNKIIECFGRELASVGFGEILDVYGGYHKGQLSEEEIIRIYRYKTAQYTFSLPFEIGARLAQLDEGVVQKLAEIGSYLGIIFQIKDDELGIFGNEDDIGKPAGSDIKENKKTLFSLYLFSQASEEEKMFLKTVFSASLTPEQLDMVRKMIDQKGIRAHVERHVQNYAKRAYDLIDQVGISEVDKDILRKLVEYNCSRSV